MNAPAMRAPLAQEAIRLPQPNEPAPCALAVAPADATPAEQWNRAAHANVAALTLGLSPVSMALAMLDWGAHLAVAPGKCFELAAQAWQAAVAHLRR
ncbi:MAG: poly-beta-hydroxybutyrate polymerase N-terminal domain-containing protein, partial [Burkholderia vietnamiensis]|nr:poly-beta-hydroxybutyrate polymerase N-terminal domain-containing protein [Burkholderia vietnamiensis]